MIKISFYRFMLVISLFWTGSLATHASSREAVDDLIEKVRAARKPLTSLAVTYRTDIKNGIIDPQMLDQADDTTMGMELSRQEGQMRIDNGRVELTGTEFFLTGDSPIQGTVYHKIWDGSRYWDSANPLVPGTWCPAWLSSENDYFRLNLVADVPAGGFMHGFMMAYPGADWLELISSTKNVDISDALDPVDGIPCRVVKARKGNEQYGFWVDETHGYVLRRIIVEIDQAKSLSITKKNLKFIKAQRD